MVALFRSVGITDTGISAIAHGCPNLEMINIAYCKDITDTSIISLSKCSRLNIFESRGCPLITSLGLAAIAVGCKQLTKLDIKKCHNINDLGMLPLARFSQNLRQVDPNSISVKFCKYQKQRLRPILLHSFHCRLIYPTVQLQTWGSCRWPASVVYRA